MPKTAAVSLLIKQLTKHFLAVPGGGGSLVGMISSRNKSYYLLRHAPGDVGFFFLLLSSVALLHGNVLKQIKENRYECTWLHMLLSRRRAQHPYQVSWLLVSHWTLPRRLRWWVLYKSWNLPATRALCVHMGFVKWIWSRWPQLLWADSGHMEKLIDILLVDFFWYSCLPDITAVLLLDCRCFLLPLGNSSSAYLTWNLQFEQ